MHSKSNIKLTSNIMLKSKYENSIKGVIYIPWELLAKPHRDLRNEQNLSETQISQRNKHLWYAKKILNEDGTVSILNDNGIIIETTNIK